jgi:hypothetical protein
MDTTQGATAAAAPKSTFSSVTDFLGITSSKPVDTEATLEADRKKYNDEIDEKIRNLRFLLR